MSKLKKIVLGLLAFFILLMAMLTYFQEKLIFLPTKLPQDFNYAFEEDFEEFFLTNTDGARLNALHFKAKNPRGLILYFHGNAGDLSRWGEIASYFVSKQYDIIVMDYRTYGKSTGKLSERALYGDAQLFYDYAKKSHDEKDIILYGRSLGSAMATYLCSQNQPKKLILETPFYSLAEVAKERFPFLPVQSLMRYGFPSYRYMKDAKCPVFIFHGTDDGVVPYESGKRLFEYVPTETKYFFTIEGGGHNNLIEFDAYHEGIDFVLLTEKF
ncbi:alpha/beta hydrolase [Allomuricauda sp. SCSIO 65647]|uniref:alpha/beta hydrolase n=1 Tax=Allomuricauda sp. SCSIO 65647 TaxID=2908843 RepID=UPI001F21FEBE|nr:alpha/beta fold hydrolase [Muricauda sp. SCSIO 65647]UJH67268.1 lysophospholipase [Muricauda sp. SCSIO 65647]